MILPGAIYNSILIPISPNTAGEITKLHIHRSDCHASAQGHHPHSPPSSPPELSSEPPDPSKPSDPSSLLSPSDSSAVWAIDLLLSSGDTSRAVWSASSCVPESARSNRISSKIDISAALLHNARQHGYRGLILGISYYLSPWLADVHGYVVRRGVSCL